MLFLQETVRDLRPRGRACDRFTTRGFTGGPRRIP